MSKQLKEEWREKYNDKVDFGVEHDFNVVDFFYSLHLDHIKAIREMITKQDNSIQDCFLVEEILKNPLLTIAE